MSELSAEYFAILQNELQEFYVPHLPPLLTKESQEKKDTKNLSRALSAFALQSKFGISADTAAKAVVDDHEDNGIDAVWYDDQSQVLYLLQTKLHATAAVLQEDIQSFCEGVRLLLRQEFSSFNNNFKNRQAEIEQALNQADAIELLIVYTGKEITAHGAARLQQLISDPTHGERDRLRESSKHMGSREISEELIRRRSHHPVNGTLTLLHAQKVENPHTTWYGQVEMTELVRLHAKEKSSLYEKNVRYYIGSKTSQVNSGIQQTLAEDPESFFYLNNGVTALCTRIRTGGLAGNCRTLKFEDLSIVNGAQTVAAAAELMQRDPSLNISQAKVMLTLIQTGSDNNQKQEASESGKKEDFGLRITRARNSQNAIVAANFIALDLIQERLRRELDGHRIIYHIRTEIGAIPATNSILLSEVMTALAWLHQDPRYPVWLKSGSNDLSNSNSAPHKALFHANLSGAHAANAVFSMRAINKLLKAAEQSSSSEERLVYRHGSHAMGSIFIKRLKKRIEQPVPTTEDDISRAISIDFDIFRQCAVDHFESSFSGPLAFFKNQSSTQGYMIRVMKDCYNLKEDSALPHLEKIPTSKDETFPRERLFNFLAQKAPQI